MKLYTPLLYSLALLLQPASSAGQLVARNLGYLEMTMSSSDISETNLLLRKLLSVTVNFLDASFFASTDSTFQKVSCSIHSYQIAGLAAQQQVLESGETALYTATVNITGQAFFLTDSEITQDAISLLTAEAFEGDDSFVEALALSPDPFLANIQSAVVKVNGYTVADQSLNGNSNSNSGEQPKLEVYAIALVAGGAAFVLVLCCILACICCVKIDEPHNSTSRRGNDEYNHTQNNSKLGVRTKPTGEFSLNTDDDGQQESSPISSRSIASQDSSVFTYNPKSVKSVGSSIAGGSYFTNSTPQPPDSKKSSGNNTNPASTYFTNATGGNSTMDSMDVTAWQKGSVVNSSLTNAPFGHDISAIEAKKDLSLIEEVSCEGTPKSSFSECDDNGSNGNGGGGSAMDPSSLLDYGGCGGGGDVGADEAASSALAMPKQYLQLTEAAMASLERNERGGDQGGGAGAIMTTPSSTDGGSITSHEARLRLNGSVSDVMEDLQDLSTQIDHYRTR